MRSLRIAICTSGDPVSSSCVSNDLMSSVLRSFVSATSVASTHGPAPRPAARHRRLNGGFQHPQTQYVTSARPTDAKARPGPASASASSAPSGPRSRTRSRRHARAGPASALRRPDLPAVPDPATPSAVSVTAGQSGSSVAERPQVRGRPVPQDALERDGGVQAEPAAPRPPQRLQAGAARASGPGHGRATGRRTRPSRPAAPGPARSSADSSSSVRHGHLDRRQVHRDAAARLLVGPRPVDVLAENAGGICIHVPRKPPAPLRPRPAQAGTAPASRLDSTRPVMS